MWLAAGGFPGWRIFLLIVAAMVAARSTAMAFNRLVDARFDAINPRTKDRPLTAGKISRTYVIGFIIVMTIGFSLACAALNPLALRLSPIALVVLCGYSFTKRFTALCHFVLGASLGLAPIAAQLAVQQQITLPFVVLGASVMLWVAGFDILYALHDVDFDRAHALHSIPASKGIVRALWISRVLHVAAAGGFFLVGHLLHLHFAYFVCATGMSIALVVEHALISPTQLNRLNAAFFTANGWVSVLFLAGSLLG